MTDDKKQRIAELEASKADILQRWQYDAHLRESEIREFAFTNRCMKIHGFDCKQFSIRHYIVLDFNNSIFINPGSAGEVNPEEVANQIADFLWIISPSYTTDEERFKQFDATVKEKIVELGLDAFIEELDDYLSKSLMDMPQDGEPDDKAPVISYVASIIDTLAGEYHWTDEYILDLPWARLLQYMRAIEQRKAKERGETTHKLHNKYTTPLELEYLRIDEEIRKLMEGSNNDAKS
jgi:hypothetical protein